MHQRGAISARRRCPATPICTGIAPACGGEGCGDARQSAAAQEGKWRHDAGVVLRGNARTRGRTATQLKHPAVPSTPRVRTARCRVPPCMHRQIFGEVGDLPSEKG